MAKFAAGLKKNNDEVEIGKQFATAIFYVERELGAHITEEYPLMKFFSQLEELSEHNERERKEMERMKR